MIRRPPRSTLFPTRRSSDLGARLGSRRAPRRARRPAQGALRAYVGDRPAVGGAADRDRKSTRLNSSHTVISYAVFCLKKKNKAEDKPDPHQPSTAVKSGPQD